VARLLAGGISIRATERAAGISSSLLLALHRERVEPACRYARFHAGGSVVSREVRIPDLRNHDMPHNEKPSRPNENRRGLSAATIIAAAVAALGAAGTRAYAATRGFDPAFPNPTTWTAVTTWHIPPAPGADFIIRRELGTSKDTTDDTRRLTFTGEYGDQVTSNSSPWEPIDVRKFGVPASATAVRLQFKAVISDGIAGTESTVYAFVKRDGSPLCPGPPGFEKYPVDAGWTGEAAEGGEKCWAVHGTTVGANGVREFHTVDVPLKHGKFDFAWGYRKPPGQGSAVAIGVWLDGWARR
jgi:hypothetical protein